MPDYVSHQSAIANTQHHSTEQHHQQQPQHIITKDGLLYEQLDYTYSAAETEPMPIKIESSYLIEQTANEAAQQAMAAEEVAAAVTAPQQHFKKKMQQKARSSKQSTLETQRMIKEEPEAPQQSLLAIIGNPDDLDDLSHLDKPITTAARAMPLMAKQSDYIASYCSFLKSRTHK